jgi:hypothetical protein
MSLTLLVAIVAAMAPTKPLASVLALAAGSLAYVVAIFLVGLVTPTEREALARVATRWMREGRAGGAAAQEDAASKTEG